MKQLNVSKKITSPIMVWVSVVLIAATLLFSFMPIMSFETADSIQQINELLKDMDIGEDEIEIPEKIDFFKALPAYEKELYYNKKSKTNPENAPVMLKAVYDTLSALPVWESTAIHDALIGLAEKLGVKNGTVMWPARISVAGKTVTPGGAIEILDILGREESLRRMRLGLEMLS